MTNKSTKRALLTSFMALFLCFAMLLGTTYAWFTDSVTSGNNVIKSGNLDIELEYWSEGEWKDVKDASDILTNTLWEPGVTEVAYLRIANAGSLVLKYQFGVNILNEIEGKNQKNETFKLSDYIMFGVVEGVNGETAAYAKTDAGRTAAIAAVTDAKKISAGYTKASTMNPNEELYLALVVYMPTNTDNVANHNGTDVPQIDLGINVLATQMTAENDNFGNGYDEAAKYVISSDEKMIFNGTEFDTLVSNNGTVDMTNAKIENDNTGFENYGDATLNGVTVNAGTPGTQAYGYAINAYAGSTTVLNDVVVNSANGAIGVTNGANLTFNSGSVDVDSESTSGRYLFYVEGAGSTLTINGGNFDFNKTQNQKRAYIYAGEGTTVYVNGGTFGKASTRSGYTAGILGSGNVIITGGTFGFNPSAWVAGGYNAVDNGNGTWTVQPETTATLAEILTSDKKNIVVVLQEDVDLPESVSKKMGGADTETIIIDLNGHKLNVTTTYSSVVGAVNSDATITIKNGSMTSSCATGTWDLYDLDFVSEIVVENVTFEKSIALEKNATLKNVTINETHDYYAMWITAKGQTVTIDGLTINSAGRGIKIDEQYVDAPAKVTLNVTNADFNTVKKAAIMVKSAAGADITLANVNIEDTIDTIHAVWVDEDADAYAHLVTVTGGEMISEANIASSNTDLTNAIANGKTEVFLVSGNYTMPEPDLRGKTMTIVGTKDTVIDVSKVDAGDQFVTGATIVFDGVTLNFGKANYMGFANTASLTYKNCTINGLQFLYGENVTFENCDLNSNGAEHCVWTYGAKNVSFTGCDFTYGDRGINCYSDNDVAGGKQTVNFTNCTFATENTASEGAVEINSIKFSVGIEVNMEGCTAPAYGQMAYVSRWDSTNGAKTTINVK